MDIQDMFKNLIKSLKCTLAHSRSVVMSIVCSCLTFAYSGWPANESLHVKTKLLLVNR